MSFGGGSGSSSIAGSTDVVLSSPVNNQVLGYNSSLAKWQNQTVSGGGGIRADSVPFNVKAYGAVGDGASAAADTAGIRAAIVAVQGSSITAGITGGHLYFPPGEYLINLTINLFRFSGKLVGCGISNPPAYSASPGQGTTLRWVGAAGSPMFLLRDYAMVEFSDLKLEGRDAAVPSYLIESRWVASADQNGTAAQLMVNRCVLGTWAWSSQGVLAGRAAVGIGFTGDNGNNDQFHIKDCIIQGCPVGIDLPNTQSIWGNITDTQFGSCTTAGIRASAGFNATNLQFDDCQVDIQGASTARINVHGWYSERSRRIFDATGSLVALNVFGGHWTFGGVASMTGNVFLNHPQITGGGQVNLEGVSMVNQLGAWPNIIARGDGGGITGLFRMVGCVHDGMTTGDLLMSGTGNGLNVVIDDAELQTRQWLGSGVSLNASLVTNHLPPG